MIIEVEAWNSVPIDEDIVKNWIREGAKDVSDFLRDNPDAEHTESRTTSGDTMVLVEGERFEDGTVIIDGYVLKVQKQIKVSQ